MQSRKASLGREWQALTNDHERELDRANESFDAFQNGDTVDPLALVGAYRSGKTQLIYHLFENAWDRDIPAFYIGDPGSMLDDYLDSDSNTLNEWLQAQIDTQLEAYAENRPEDIHWFPNVDSETKREYVATYSESIEGTDIQRTALFFDEVEQSYRAFIRAMDKDDDNPLRKINDGLQDCMKVWSFGMISAFEFIGEADWGRMKEIRIPPLEVPEVRQLLEEERPDAVEFSNTIWWLARGRTGIIIKLIEELPEDISSSAPEWLRELAEADFKDTRLIDNLWTQLDREDWNPALRALLFQADSHPEWHIKDEEGVTASDCQSIVIDILQDKYEFDATDTGRDAISILDRNVERVIHGLAVGEDQLIPRHGFGNPDEATAFIDLISNLTVSFEPAGDDRRQAIDALDELKGSFQPLWLQQVSDIETVSGSVVTAAPTKIRDSFPPIAVNPERVAKEHSDDLRDTVNSGFEMKTGIPENETVSIKFCPTRSAFKSELSELTRSYDITSPTILVIPDQDDAEFEDHVSADAAVYRTHQLLRIEEYQSTRFWSFIINLYGRLESQGFSNPYTIDDKTKGELINQVGEREVRNTIETLYDQLRQVAEDKLTNFATEYESTYSLTDKKSLLWNEERLQGTSPYWSNGRFVESTVALSYLPVFSIDYESGRNYVKLQQHLESAIDEDLVSGGKNGFAFSEYFDELFTQNGYSQDIRTERAHYRQQNDFDPAVRQTESALTDLAELNDVSSIVSDLDQPDMDVKEAQTPVVGIDGLSKLGYGFMRALLLYGLTTGEDAPVDVANRLENKISELSSQLQKIENHIEDVNTLDDDVSPPEEADVGTWIDIDANRLTQYELNINQIIEATEDLVEKCRSDPAAGAIGYHYWFLLDIYIDDIQDEIDSLQNDVSRAHVTKIKNAVELFDDLYTRIQDSDAIPMHFDSPESLLGQLEDYGDEVFDLEGKHGATSLSIPEDYDDLTQLNGEFQPVERQLNELNQDMTTIENQSESIRVDFQETKSEVTDLLEPEEVVPNEQ